jgi:hypothetical protein
MQESCSYGSVGERGGNEPLYPEMVNGQFGNWKLEIENKILNLKILIIHA